MIFLLNFATKWSAHLTKWHTLAHHMFDRDGPAHGCHLHDLDPVVAATGLCRNAAAVICPSA